MDGRNIPLEQSIMCAFCMSWPFLMTGLISSHNLTNLWDLHCVVVCICTGRYSILFIRSPSIFVGPIFRCDSALCIWNKFKVLLIFIECKNFIFGCKFWWYFVIQSYKKSKINVIFVFNLCWIFNMETETCQDGPGSYLIMAKGIQGGCI